MTRSLPIWIGAMTVGAVAGLAIAASASAHVEVEADGDAVAGQPAQLVFVVPNERSDESTMTIEIQMPQDVDLTDVVPGDVEGWTVTTTTRLGDIVDTIRWDTTGPGLVDDDSLELPVAVGPLPEVEFLTFPTVQTYSDGAVVRWIEPAPPGEPEPDRPVPTLAITPAPPGATTAPTEPAATEPAATEPSTSPTTEPADTAATDSTTPSTEAVVVAPSPTDTITVTEATETPAPATSVDVDGDGGSAVWPWVVAGVIIVLVAGGAAIAMARRRTSA